LATCAGLGKAQVTNLCYVETCADLERRHRLPTCATWKPVLL